MIQVVSNKLRKKSSLHLFSIHLTEVSFRKGRVLGQMFGNIIFDLFELYLGSEDIFEFFVGQFCEIIYIKERLRS